jgi:hypothetical protein
MTGVRLGPAISPRKSHSPKMRTPERIPAPAYKGREGMTKMPLLLVLRLRLWGRRVLTLAITLERH